MKKILLITVLVLGLASTGFAFDREGPHAERAIKRGVTPYGDFCPRCTIYGVGHEPVGHDKAVAAMKAYFGKRGYSIGNVRSRGRFMRVDIFRGDRLVDRIIFDRRTGRIRSIY